MSEETPVDAEAVARAKAIMDGLVAQFIDENREELRAALVRHTIYREPVDIGALILKWVAK